MNQKEEGRLLLVCPDLVLKTKIRELLSNSGYLISSLKESDLIAAIKLNSEQFKIVAVVIDLHDPRDPINLIEWLAAERPEIKSVGFYSHVAADLAEAAKDAGVSVLLRRSQLEQLSGMF